MIGKGQKRKHHGALANNAVEERHPKMQYGNVKRSLPGPEVFQEGEEQRIGAGSMVSKATTTVRGRPNGLKSRGRITRHSSVSKTGANLEVRISHRGLQKNLNLGESYDPDL
jgi:hypothetical protein